MFGKKKKDKNEENSESFDGQKKENNFDKLIKENVSIHKMPKDIKRGVPRKDPEVSKDLEKKVKQEIKKESTGFLKGENKPSKSKGESSWDKTKVIGAIIIFSGVVILLGGIYLGYVYFIKPSDNNPVALSQKETELKSKNSEKEQEISKKEENKNVENSQENKEEKEVKKEEATTSVEEKEEATTSVEKKEEELNEKEKIQYQDNDNDGLSNLEETILGLDINKEDTDGDGYSDSQELLNLYNPNGENSLDNNSQISTYASEEFFFSLLYPKKWITQEVGSNNAVMFKAQDGSFIQVIVRSNDGNISIEDWYNKQFTDNKEELEVEERDNWQGINKKDSSVFYLTDLDRKNIYVISLTSLSNEKAEYSNIFSMLVNSFEIE
ncbi:hypothetical protein K8R62_02240 [bacterium]|nr:hypothetical protein [bacterium]